MIADDGFRAAKRSRNKSRKSERLLDYATGPYTSLETQWRNAQEQANAVEEPEVVVADGGAKETAPHIFVNTETKSSTKTLALEDATDVDLAGGQPRKQSRIHSGKTSVIAVPVPPNRMTPLRQNWVELIRPMVQNLKLQVRMCLRRKAVEIRPSPQVTDMSYVQKGAEFVRAYLLGFEIIDALALLRMDDLFIESFEISDVKRLTGDHLSRCIGRISGKEGKTKHAIENSTRTRIVLADKNIHLLGTFQNIKLARDAICSLILGTPPGKVHDHLKNVSRRLRER